MAIIRPALVAAFVLALASCSSAEAAPPAGWQAGKRASGQAGKRASGFKQ